MKIVADYTIPFLHGIAEDKAEVVYAEAAKFTPELIQDADALIVRSIDKCTPQLLESSRVKLITTATIGFDHIDTRYCDAVGIAWRNAPGCNAPSVGQYVLASLSALSLRTNEPLAGKTLGIVGVGHVGSVVERIAKALGMNVLLNDPPRAAVEGSADFVSLDEILASSDIVTLHVPLTKTGEYATYHLADTDFFSKLKHKVWFINACRGAVHNTAALLQAYQSGKVGEIIIDCWENEPHISLELLEKTSFASPHIAGFSADGKANGTRMCLEAIQEFFHLKFDKLPQVVPPAPANPIIDLDEFANHRTERAIMKTYNPIAVDGALRQTPEKFEWFRNNYDYPREPLAYTVRHATSDEAEFLQKFGFKID